MISLMKLSPEQRRAVDSLAAATVVIAPAGSGKTEVLAQRVERFLQRTLEDGYRVCALTYTVKAADELARRFDDRLGDLSRRVDADTFHGFALGLLRQYGSRIGVPSDVEVLARDEDRLELLQDWYSGQGIGRELTLKMLQETDVLRSRGESSPLANDLQDALSDRDALDFPAVFEKAVLLLKDPWVSRQVRTLYGLTVVDEAQNLTLMQFNFLVGLVGNPHDEGISVMLVGDTRQSIVGFAGADPRLLDRAREQFDAETIVLDRNYRSSAAIVRTANRVSLALDSQSKLSESSVFAAEGLVAYAEYASEEEEAASLVAQVRALLAGGIRQEYAVEGESKSVRPEDIAVLGRTASSLSPVAEALSGSGINFAMGSTQADWLASSQGRLLLAILEWKAAPGHHSAKRNLSRELGGVEFEGDDEIFLARADVPYASAFSGVVTSDAPAVAMSAVAELEFDDPDWIADKRLITAAWTDFMQRTPERSRTFSAFFQSIGRVQRGDNLSEGVRLLTVHRAQGREFKVVFIVALNDGQLPDFRAQSRADLLAELRVFYVAVTRASRLLYLSRSRTRRTRFGLRRTDPSPFLRHVTDG